MADQKQENVRSTAATVLLSQKKESRKRTDSAEDDHETAATKPSSSPLRIQKRKLGMLIAVGVVVVGAGLLFMSPGAQQPKKQLPADNLKALTTTTTAPAYESSLQSSSQSSSTQPPPSALSGIAALSPNQPAPQRFDASGQKLSTTQQAPMSADSIVVEQLKEQVEDLEGRLQAMQHSLDTLEKTFRQSDSTDVDQDARINELKTVLSGLEQKLSTVSNDQEYAKVLQQNEQKTSVRILSEESVEILGKVYYVGDILTIKNRRYVITAIKIGDGVYIKDGAQKQFVLPEISA